MTKKDVAQIVERYLQDQPRPEAMAGITLQVLADNVYREGGGWRVPVLASAEPRWTYAYYEVLAEVEADLDEKENLNVLFLALTPADVVPESLPTAA